ncbi:MAG TPA: tannase/feruloyl esterase family alpha/beta hydrolase [Steroidobacteraceae bacterium]|jgi:feruloyl esterase|nr:tannase/feruloyl esterase family alpha/beta hydrolase [Steroidobacteraceae bacterium]
MVNIRSLRRSVLRPVIALIALTPLASVAENAADVGARRAEGTLNSGALWASRVPGKWNGTLLLYSHGYSPAIRAPEIAPRGLEDWLLAHGYGLLASSYSTAGWAVAEAVPDQLAALEVFTQKFGKPRRVIAWGESMGALVTIALAEQRPARISAALASCGSLAGSVAMMNQALDAAFAFRTLLAPQSAIRLVAVDDDVANGARVRSVLEDAMRTPAGRARIALASALGQLPAWSQPNTSRSDVSSPDERIAQVSKTFVMGVFLPRTDQERRAGGVFSWNTNVDYRKQLEKSGDLDWVRAMYAKAQLDLDQDLDALNAAPRIAADPDAVAYMKRYYAPNGQLSVPALSYHTIGDGATVPSHQAAYEQTVSLAGRGSFFRSAWSEAAGHCAFTPGEHVAALRAIESRLKTGKWDVTPARLNALAREVSASAGRFTSDRASAFLRPCRQTKDAPCEGEPVRPQSACSMLESWNEGEIEIVSARDIVPNPEWRVSQDERVPAVKSAFCRIEGTIKKRIGFELWLPQPEAWNGRLLSGGVGGDAGVYNYVDLARGVSAGFASATTDTGHKSASKAWMMDRVALLDYAFRAQHELAVSAKRIIAKYYKSPARHSYFIGCSGGGRQALKEAQQFPNDYDGIIAGASAPDLITMSARHAWHGLYQSRHPEGALNADEWKLVSDAATAACDAQDGVTDGVVEYPPSCAFDVGTLQCSLDRTRACLSAAQVETVRAISAPLRDESGKQLDEGLLPGVRTRPGPPSPVLAALFGQAGHHDLAWSIEQFNMTRDVALVRSRASELDASSTDLRPFAARGGKLILYQGWMDPSVIAEQSLDYARAVEERVGSARAREFMRLFMVPGMLHCAGGSGADQFGASMASTPIGEPEQDVLMSTVRWVEQGIAPEQIIATRYEDGKPVKRHPLCAFPMRAVYRGGNASDASSFTCAAPGDSIRQQKDSDAGR